MEQYVSLLPAESLVTKLASSSQEVQIQASLEAILAPQDPLHPEHDLNVPPSKHLNEENQEHDPLHPWELQAPRSPHLSETLWISRKQHPHQK